MNATRAYDAIVGDAASGRGALAHRSSEDADLSVLLPEAGGSTRCLCMQIPLDLGPVGPRC
jgi:hypothetical protein